MNRKLFLKYSGLSGLVVLAGGIGAILTACGNNATQQALTTTATINSGPGVSSGSSSGVQVLDPTKLGNFITPLNLPGREGALAVFDATAPFEIVTRPASFEILNGKKADMLTYQVIQNGKTYINPILRVKKGDVRNAI